MTVSLPLDTDGRSRPIELDDVSAAIAAEERSVGPWVIVNMVASLDGATAVEGVSGALGDDVDRAVFLALRGVADVILVGSGTVTAERYRRVRLDDGQRRRRVEQGRAPTPRIAVVSNAGDLDLDLPLFEPGPSETLPVVLIARNAISEDRRRALDAVAEVVEAGEDRVDVASAVEQLTSRVGPVVTCEGGPILNGLLAERDLIDEWCLTLAPMLVAGDSSRAAVGAAVDRPRSMRLDRVWHHRGELLLRYLRAR